jgi:hypothetical protein
MRKVVYNDLFEQMNDDNEPDRHLDVNLEDELSYFTDLEDGLKDDPDAYQQFKDAIEEFGLDSEETAIISSYGADADWEDIKEELDRRQIEYYEFDTDDGESAILFNINDLQSEKDEKDFKRSWGGGSTF